MPNNVLKNETELFDLMDQLVPHARPIVWIACLTGLRKSNTINLNVEDVDLQRRIIQVVQKGGRYHATHIHASLIPMLEYLIDGREDGPLFRFGQDHCKCRLCSQYRKPATSGKPHYVAGQDRKGSMRPVRCIETGEIFKSQKQARDTLIRRDYVKMGSPDQIGQVCRGNRKSAGGFTWEFVPAPTPLPTRNRSYRGGERIASIDKVFRNARKAIGREDVRFHDLRHSIATWLTAAGVPLPVVQEHLGHRSILTTRRYAHVSPRATAYYLDEKIDGGYKLYPRDNKKNEAISLSDQGQNPENNAPQTRPKTTVPVLFDDGDNLSY